MLPSVFPLYATNAMKSGFDLCTGHMRVFAMFPPLTSDFFIPKWSAREIVAQISTIRDGM